MLSHLLFSRNCPSGSSGLAFLDRIGVHGPGLGLQENLMRPPSGQRLVDAAPFRVSVSHSQSRHTQRRNPAVDSRACRPSPEIRSWFWLSPSSGRTFSRASGTGQDGRRKGGGGASTEVFSLWPRVLAGLVLPIEGLHKEMKRVQTIMDHLAVLVDGEMRTRS